MRKENGAVTERIPYSRVGFYNGKTEHNLKQPRHRTEPTVTVHNIDGENSHKFFRGE